MSEYTVYTADVEVTVTIMYNNLSIECDSEEDYEFIVEDVIGNLIENALNDSRIDKYEIDSLDINNVELV